MTARVLFEPIGEEIDCEDDESVLDAAFRQGYSLVHGCREGQCSACKAYLLEGEVSLKPYSTFALSETEETQGYTLLCRAMPDDDLVVELLHFDPDDYKLAHPIVEGSATVTAIEALTHDITRLELEVVEPDDFAFEAGQYVDVAIPGSEEEHRSFSMANLPGEGRIELMIKRYEGGRFSGLLGDGGLSPGDTLAFKGPYGALRLRPTERPVLMVAGGSGMAPILGLLRKLAGDASEREVRFFYGARTQADLFALEEIEALGARLADFAFTPVLSEEDWDGACGFVHDTVGTALESGELQDCEVYMCGPPPMVEAATELLVDAHGIDESDLHVDKFTIAAAAEHPESATGQREGGWS